MSLQELQNMATEAQDAASNGVNQIKAAMKKAGIEAESLRARVNEEIRQARQFADDRFGGNTLRENPTVIDLSNP